MKYFSNCNSRCQNAPSLSLLLCVTCVNGLHGQSFQRRHSPVTVVGTARHQERASLCTRAVSTGLSALCRTSWSRCTGMRWIAPIKLDFAPYDSVAFCSCKIADLSHIRVGKRRHGIYLLRDASMVCQRDAGLQESFGTILTTHHSH